MAGKRKDRSAGKRHVLVIDVGGSKIKLRRPDGKQVVKFPSGKSMTPDKMVMEAQRIAAEWSYDVVSIGFPGPVIHGHPADDPKNLGSGWTRFDYKKAFRRPVKLINDAAMQALGSYENGRMLFLGLGTGLGSALIVDDILVPLELGEIRYSRTKTMEDVLGKSALKKRGRPIWERSVHAAVANLKKAFLADNVILGGGNAKKLKRMPAGARRGANRYAFRGGVRLWENGETRPKLQKHTLIIT